ncbi:MAG: J domain-containing protein [Reichenbachiella sp.]
MLNHYELLGVTSKATKEEIKSAFKEKALLYHPDRHFGDVEKEEHFKLLNAAYQVLSNNYSRSQYDMLRAAQTQQYRQATYHNAPQQPNYQQPRHQSKPRSQGGNPKYNPYYHRARPSVTSKENIRATGYAFGLAFGFALLIMITVFSFKYFEDREYAEKLAERRVVYEQAVSQYDQGKSIQSLETVTEIGRFFPEEIEQKEFKKSLIVEMKKNGDDFFDEEQYGQALEMYGALSDFSIAKTMSYRKKMAFAYKGNGQIEEAIDIYRTLHLYGYESLDFYYEMGQLYEEGLSNYEQALKYYKISSDKAISTYEVTIGKAYPIVITAAMIPKSHYDIYMNVAEMNYKAGKYEEAVVSVAWSKGIWPDSAFQYQIEINSLIALAREEESETVFQEAKLHIPDFEMAND